MPDAAPFFKRPDRYSMSVMRWGEHCLLAAAHTKVANVAGPDAALGSLAHEAFAAIRFACLVKGQEFPSLQQALGIAERMAEQPSGPGPLSIEHHGALMGLVTRWADTARVRPDADDVRIEHLAVHELAGRDLSARLDYLAVKGEVAEIDDDKTGPGMPLVPVNETRAQAEARKWKSIQAAVYAWHVGQDYPGVQVFVFRELWTRYGKPIATVFVRDDLPRVEKFLRAQVARLDAAYGDQEFPPSPGSWCSNCPAPSRCPLPPWARPATWITTANEAHRALEEVLAGKAAITEREKAIRAWVDASGHQGITVGDQRAGYSEKVESRFDKKAAAQAGVDVDRFTERKHGARYAIGKAS